MGVDKNLLYKQMTSGVCGSLEIEKAIQNSFDYLKKYIPADGLTLDISQPDNSMLSIARADSKGVELYDIRIPLSAASLQEEKDNMHRKDVMIFNAPNLNPTSIDYAKCLNLKEASHLVMNLISNDELIGSVSYHAFGQNIYTKEHADILYQVKEPLTIAMLNALKFRELQTNSDDIIEENRMLYQELSEIHDDVIIGSDSGLKEVMNLAKQVAPVECPVIVLGETGTGKDVIANAIHKLSDRNKRPIVKINCGAMPENLIDSELFGHEKGAFTGAVSQKKGKLERAHGGTLFLDEIGELPLDAQVRLLRAIQFKEIERVGGTKTINVDVRVIAATHRNLEELVKSGKFREDLYYRLNVFPINITPLRERREDIPSLAYYFIEKKSKDLNLHSQPALTDRSLNKLMNYDWPGNVRELANVIERSLIINRNGELTFDILPEKPTDKKTENSHSILLSLDEAISEHISKALKISKGRIEGAKGAAKLLNLNPNTLRSKIKKYNIAYKKGAHH